MKVFIFSFISSILAIIIVNAAYFEGSTVEVFRNVFYFAFPTAILLSFLLLILGYIGGFIQTRSVKTISHSKASEAGQYTPVKAA